MRVNDGDLVAATSAAQGSNADGPILGNSELARLMRAYDWANTPLGRPDTWPRSLRTAVGIMLTSRQPIWIGWGDDLIYLYNDPYKSIIGGKHPWALGKPTSQVWREIWQDIGPMLSQAMGGDEGTYVEAQLLIMERNGYPEETYYTFSYSPIPDDNGAPGGIFCANSDDTQRVIGERQLALLRDLAAVSGEARTWQQACLRSAKVLASDPHDLPFAMIYTLEADGRTATLASTAGIAADHPSVLPTLTIDEESPWPLAEVIKKHQAKIVENLELEFQATFPSGAWQTPPRNAVVLPIMPSGETGRAGFLIAGLNPFRLFDDNYSSFMNLIAGQIAAAIANAEAYEQERRRAEALTEIDRAKTAFFSNVSHEFRTPLTLMLGPLEDALRHSDQLPRERLEEVTVAHRNAMRLLRLVNTLLDFSRVEAGRAQVTREQTDLASLTKELSCSFSSVCERAGIALNILCDELPRPVYVDRDMWEKIVLNLLSNAFKFTFAGGIDVRLRNSNNRAELTVLDTGVGIPAAELPHIFERFHRVEGQHGRTHEGSGIGLALVRELVNLHGGEVSVESEVGRGTAFKVTLPYGEPEAAARSSPSQTSTATKASAFVEEAIRWLPGKSEDDTAPLAIPREWSEEPPVHAGSLEEPRARILLADDSADMRDYVRKLLAPHFDVQSVANGQEALQAIRKRRPDLLLSDVMMPLLDGFGLLHEIRADPDLNGLPVILLSARAGDESKVSGLNAGADDYLVKPFSAQELLARVNANIAMARIRRKISAELEVQKSQLQTVLATVPVAVWYTYDSDAWHVTCNRYAAELLRASDHEYTSLIASLQQHKTLPFRVFQNRSEIVLAQLPLRRALKGEVVVNEEFELRFADGLVVPIVAQASPLRDPSGRIIGAVCAALDISERKRVEDHRLLLLNELNHRVKNTLATVQSIAVQSFRGSKAEADARKQFEARLIALSRAHDVLTEESWQGANLDNIVAQVIAPYLGGPAERFLIGGPPVRLTAKMALSISMALHELATNAAKYGALSDDKGRIAIKWRTQPDTSNRQRLIVEWQETEGPPVKPPQQKGFGSRLIERGLAQELGGETMIEYRPAGVWCQISTRLGSP